MADATVNVIDPATAEVSSIPQEQLHDAMSQGYTQASPQDVQQFLNKQKYETPLEEAKTAAEGAGEGLAGPLFTGAERLAGVSPEGMLGRRQINPGIHGSFQGLGLAGGMLAGTGEAALLEKAGVGASELAGLGGEGASLLSKIGGGATRAAVENALFQGGDEASKLLVNDPEQSVGSAVTNIGLSGLMGAGLGAGMGAISPLWDAKMGGKMGQFIEDFKGRINQHLENPDPVGMLTKELEDLHGGITSANDEVWGPKGLKSQEIKSLIPSEMTEPMAGQAKDLLKKTQSMVQTFEEDPDLYPRGNAARFARDASVFANGIKSAENPGEMFSAIQDFKQRLQDSVNYGWQGAPKAEEEISKMIKNLGFDVRTGLENPEIWGAAGERQQAINGAFKEFLPALKDFQSKFMEKSGNEKVISPGKVQTYLNQEGKAGQIVKRDMLGKFMDASEKYQQVLDKTHANLGLESPFQPSSLTAAKSSLNEMTPGARVADTLVKKGLSRLGGEAMGLSIGAGAGHALGSGFLGALIGEHALAPFFTSILPGLVKPMIENPNSARGLKSAIDLGLSVFKGESLMNKAAKGLFKAGQEVLPKAILPSEKDRAKLEKTMEAYQTNPQKMSEIGGAVGHYLPQHGQVLAQTSVSAMNYLNSLKPSTTKQAPLDGEVKVSKVAEGAYHNALNIAEQPLTVLDHIQKGTLTPEDLVHLDHLYPGFHQRMIQKLTNEMGNVMSKGQSIPYKVRLGLSMFMGQPLDSTMTPQAIQSTQPQAQLPMQQPQQRAKHSMTALNKMPNLEMTPQQSREVSRLKS